MAVSNKDLLANLAADVTRIQVIDEFGKTKYKKPSDIGDRDKILLNSLGEPVVMTNQPGRKKKPDLQPTSDKVAEIIRAKEMHIDDDYLLDMIKTNPETGMVLDYVMQGMAEEAASLGFERTMAERAGQPTSQISLRRINALKAVGDSWLKRKEQQSAAGVDLDSKAFERVFLYIMDTFRDTVMAVIPNVRPELIETMFADFSKRVDDDNWKREASKRMSEG